MEEYKNILNLAAQGRLPNSIDKNSAVPLAQVRELIEAGHLKACDASTFDGEAYLEPRITLLGRKYLAELAGRSMSVKMKTQGKNEDAMFNGMSTLCQAKAWGAIEKEFGVSKRSFAKRISFIKDSFSRNVIFRDIEHAYILAHFGFNKPSVVLAGGVIEELLRMYLIKKNVTPERNTLDSYLKACEKHGVLKVAINELADSFRQFRNIVHLERERSKKDSVSKATAKGAVSSVFTLANDFNA